VLAHFAQNRPEPTSFPALAMQIINIISEPDLDMNQLIQVISPDPAISLHVLRAANSALNSRGNEIQDLRRAVLHIGTREVGEIALGVASRSLFDLSLKAEFEFYRERWHRMFLDSMAVAFAGSRYAFENQMGRADHAFLAGMFHDIGKSLGLRSVAALVMDGEIAGPIPDRVLDEVLEQVHLEIGCDLHRLWGLPDYLTEICARHHDPVVPAGHEHMAIHTLRLVEGFHRLALDPSNLERLNETRQSIRATGMVRRGIQRLYTDMEMQAERVQLMFPA
jgi:HD-like signal output (HDOD) protein